MKKIFMVVALSLFIYGCTNNPSADEHPTKEEWLDVYITHKIKQTTDLWEERIAVEVGIISEVKVITITLASAIGQKEMSQTVRKIYADDVEEIVKSILKKYEWAKNYELIVQYI